METTLYNGMLAGLSLDGAHYFYPNPLSAAGEGQARVHWFDCACCPPNLARLLASLPGYHLRRVGARAVGAPVRGEAAWMRTLPGAGRLSLAVDTDYPWSGEVRFTVRQAPAEPGGAAVAGARLVRPRRASTWSSADFGRPPTSLPRLGSGPLSPRGRGLG